MKREATALPAYAAIKIIRPDRDDVSGVLSLFTQLVIFWIAGDKQSSGWPLDCGC
jgi:hypothetical protein